jgi:hypothetical protein
LSGLEITASLMKWESLREKMEKGEGKPDKTGRGW